MDLILFEGDSPTLSRTTEDLIIGFEKQMKYMEEQKKVLRTAILDEMEARGIKSIETEKILITYVAETDRESFDGKGFRKDHQDLYDKYVQIRTVNPSVRVKIK